MVKPSYYACFLLEALQTFRVADKMCREKFKRRLAASIDIGCEIHFAHPAHADQRLNAIVTDRLSHHRAGAVFSQKFWSDLEGRRFDEILRPLIRSDQRFHFAPQSFIPLTSGLKKR